MDRGDVDGGKMLHLSPAWLIGDLYKLVARADRKNN